MMAASISPSARADEQLMALFGQTMSPVQSVREGAEKMLATASLQSGFLPSLLALVAQTNPEAGSVKMAAAVYLKNQVEKRWSRDGEPDDTISAADRQALRDSIVPAVLASASQPAVMKLLRAVVHRMVRSDFPKKWTGVLEGVAQLVLKDSPDELSLRAGLLVLHEIVEWKGYENDELSEQIYSSFFPRLYLIANAALSAQNWPIVKAILKTVFSAIAYRSTPAVLGEDSVVQWCTLLSQVIAWAVPEAENALDEDEKGQSLFWKTRKWAFHCQNKIISRYGCPDGSNYQKRQTASGSSFAKFYMANLALPILKVNLEAVQAVVHGQAKVPGKIFCLMCDYLGELVRNKTLWEAVKPHVRDLIVHFLFPRMCHSAEDEELWQEDPLEYVRSKLDPFDEYYSPTTAASNLVLELVKCRKKYVFQPLIAFISEVLGAFSAAPSGKESQRRMDGVLFLIGSLAKVLLNSEMSGQVEPLLQASVIPVLSAQTAGFLRVRACWTIEQFADIKYSREETVMEALKGILTCLQDRTCLPVQVQAAIAIGALLDQESCQKAIVPILPSVTEAILALNSQAEVDALAIVLEKLVSMYADELAPYAEQLCISVRDTAIRMITAQKEAGGCETDGSVHFEDTDRMMALVGMMKTLVTLVESMSASQAVLGVLEPALLPAIRVVFENRVSDVYDETFELIQSITFLRKAVSADMWSVCMGPFVQIFQSSGLDHAEEIAACLDNLVTYDSATILANPGIAQAIHAIIVGIMQSEEEGYGQEAEAACGLMEAILMNCRGAVDGMAQHFVKLVIARLTSDSTMPDADTILHLEVVLSALFYNPGLALSTLEAIGSGASESFFSRWFLLSSKFTRVHDKRLALAAGSAILSLPPTSLPLALQQHLPMLLSTVAEAIQTLPKAMEERKRLQEEAENEDDQDDFDYDDYADDSDYAEIDSDEEDNKPDKHHQQPRKTEGEEDGEDLSDFDEYDNDWEDEELEENIYFETALDQVDIAGLVQSSIVQFARQHSSTFQQAMQQLTPEQQHTLSSIAQ